MRFAASTRIAPSFLNAAAPALSLFIIGLTAFLTVVDLFATQAILPSLTAHYGVSPAEMGVAVNASTLGMAISGLATALFSQKINRRYGIVASLALLAVPTALLAHAPDLTTFAALRVAQGVLMASAFALTLAYLGERCSAAASAGAFAAYITGNVASNLIGRLIAAAAAGSFGLEWTFYMFAALNLLGGALVFTTIRGVKAMPGHETMAKTPLQTLAAHLSNPELRTAYAIGFLILFAFIGTFTYVNFVLVQPPLALGMTSLGVVYFVFAPSILSTPIAGSVVRRMGARRGLWIGFAVAILGLPALLASNLFLILVGMVLIACGTFFAQAVATGFVSRTATADRGAASGLYLSSYFSGGLIGSAVLGQLYDKAGWAACVGGVGAALAAAAALSSLIGATPRVAAVGAASSP